MGCGRLDSRINNRNDRFKRTFTGAPTIMDPVLSVQNQTHAATFATLVAAVQDKGAMWVPNAHCIPPNPAVRPPVIASNSGDGTDMSDGTPWTGQ